MDPSPKSHPILSFVMSRLPSLKSQTQNHDEYDIEQPRISPRAPNPFPQIELVDRFPHLSDPALLAAMKSAVADVAQTRSILRVLGPRPDHEAVDLAKSRIAKIQHETQNEDIKSELVGLKAIVQLDEMHESYENLLKDAEARLVKIYEGHNCGSKLEAVDEEEEMVSEEVMTILRDAEANSLDKAMLAGKGLRYLPEGFGRIRGLVVLDLSNNLLETIPDSIAGLEHLQELRAASNLLVSLPDSIGFLLSLKILDVSGNKLKALPDSISNCRSLVELDPSYNALAYLPTNIGHNLVNLEKLYVQLNKLRSLPSSICEMRSLRVLDAHFNELHGLPYAIGKLSNLEVLNLSSNFTDLQELPPSLCDCFNLTELDLSNNQIHALPDTFGRLEKLVKLNLDQNPLQVPPMEIVNLGVGAVMEYMSKRRLDMLLEEEQRSQQAETPSKAAWLTRSMSSLVTGVSEYLSGAKSPRDHYLDQEL